MCWAYLRILMRIVMVLSILSPPHVSGVCSAGQLGTNQEWWFSHVRGAEVWDQLMAVLSGHRTPVGWFHPHG
jgi:hypothetical protein